MITNYSRPQSIIKQIFEQTTSSTKDRINAFIIGPAYQLMRYDNALERASIFGTTFNTAGHITTPLPYENLNTGAIVDTDYVQVFGEGLQAKLASFTNTTINSGTTLVAGQKYEVLVAGDYSTWGGSPAATIGSVFTAGSSPAALTGALSLKSATFKLPNLAQANKIQLSYENSTAVSTSSLDSGVFDARFNGRSVQAGDLVRITDPATNTLRTRTVLSVERLLTSSTLAFPATGLNYVTNPTTNPSSFVEVSKPSGWTISATAPNFIDLNGPTYKGKFGDRLSLVCTTAGTSATARFSLRSYSGKYSLDNISATFSTPEYSIYLGVAIGCTVQVEAASGLEDPFVVGDAFAFELSGDYSQLTGSNFIISGTYTGLVDTTYYLKVTKASSSYGAFTGAEVSFFDTTGVDVTGKLTLGASGTYAVGNNGLNVNFASVGALNHGGLRLGDVYVVEAKAAIASGNTAIVTLNGSAVDTTLITSPNYTINNVEFLLSHTGVVAQYGSVKNWTATSTGVTVEPGVALYVTGRSFGNEWVPCETAVGKLFTHYRALTPASLNETIFEVYSPADIIDNAGKIDKDNTLAYGLLMALNGAQGKRVFGGKISANNAAGYSVVLKEASNRDDLYAVAPLTNDSTILAVVKSHVEAMSVETKKQWRRAYFSTDTSQPFSKLYRQSNNALYTASILTDTTSTYRRLVSTNADFIEADVRVGDVVRLNYSTDLYGRETYVAVTVALVIAKDELLLTTAVTGQLLPARFEIWASNDGYNIAKRVAATSTSYSSRRVMNIWVDSPEVLIDNVYVSQKPYYIAAEIAGLRSAVLVHQGLTYTEVSSVSRASKMYTNYAQEELDIAAAAGTYIITQETKGGSIFIRHQLTTKTDEGSLFYEDSVGVNADEISYAIKDMVQPYIGKRNATPQTVVEMKTAYENILIARTNAPTFQTLGPQIIAVVPGTLKVNIDPVFKDQINLTSKVELPLPLNKVVVEQIYTTTLA